MTITDYGSWMKPYPLLAIQSNPAFNTTHVHPLISIRTLHYFGQFALSLGKAPIFSLNSSHLIRTSCFYGPINVRIYRVWLSWWNLYTPPLPLPHPRPCSRVRVQSILSLRARNKIKARWLWRMSGSNSVCRWILRLKSLGRMFFGSIHQLSINCAVMVHQV